MWQRAKACSPCALGCPPPGRLHPPRITLAGTVAAAVMLLANVTVLCAAVPVAGAFNVTVAVELANAPTTLVGFKV